MCVYPRDLAYKGALFVFPYQIITAGAYVWPAMNAHISCICRWLYSKELILSLNFHIFPTPIKSQCLLLQLY